MIFLQQIRCLLLSAGCSDYVIDAIALHDHLPQLNKIMSDSAILKVSLHLKHHSIFWTGIAPSIAFASSSDKRQQLHQGVWVTLIWEVVSLYTLLPGMWLAAMYG